MDWIKYYCSNDCRLRPFKIIEVKELSQAMRSTLKLLNEELKEANLQIFN